MANNIQPLDPFCLLPRPDIAELHDAVSTEFSKRLLGGAPVLPLSSEDILAFVMAGTVNLMFGTITQTLREYDPATMCCDNLVRYAARHGINMLGATRAKGYVAVTGEPGAPIPSNIRFIGAASTEYQLDLGVSFNATRLNDAGGAVLRIVSVLPGASFNLTNGTMLTVGTTLPGIDIDAVVVGNGILGGNDEETCEHLRVRVLSAEAQGVLSTNEKWYIEQTAKYPGVTRACTDQCEGCCDPAHIEVYPFFEGVYGDVAIAPYGIPPAEVIEEMNFWMFGQDNGKGQGVAPVGITGHYSCATPAHMTVVAHCFRGCKNMAVDRISDALRAYLRGMYCVGSKMCKEHLRSVIHTAVGEPCFSTVDFTFDVGLRREDAAYLVLDCGAYPVLGEVHVVDEAS